MRINNVSINTRSEVISTTRKPSFKAVPKVNNLITDTECTLSQRAIDRLGLDITTRVGYKGPRPYQPAPETLPEYLKKYFDMLEVDWNTHVDKKPKKMYA